MITKRPVNDLAACSAALAHVRIEYARPISQSMNVIPGSRKMRQDVLRSGAARTHAARRLPRVVVGARRRALAD
eukprot:14681672-Alexandrium_andersonii.AAC.1